MKRNEKIILGAMGLSALLILAALLNKPQAKPTPPATEKVPPVVPANNEAYQNLECPW